VEQRLHQGHVACYDCFCHICEDLGFPSVWKLTPLDPK
jgi:hypothetical protein